PPPLHPFPTRRSSDLSTSTIAPATARRLAEGHRQYGVAYLAAPVLGRPDAAAAAKLWVFLSGEPAARERAQPVLRALGQGVFDLDRKSTRLNSSHLVI